MFSRSCVGSTAVLSNQNIEYTLGTGETRPPASMGKVILILNLHLCGDGHPQLYTHGTFHFAMPRN